MKGILTALLIIGASSCGTGIPEYGKPESRSEEKPEGITVTVDTATTESEYNFEIQM